MISQQRDIVAVHSIRKLNVNADPDLSSGRRDGPV
jgi:hypothetical protein